MSGAVRCELLFFLNHSAVGDQEKKKQPTQRLAKEQTNKQLKSYVCVC